MNIRRYFTFNLIICACIYGALIAFSWSVYGLADPFTIFVVVFPLLVFIAHFYFHRRNPIAYYSFMLQVNPRKAKIYHNRGKVYLSFKQYQAE